MNAKEYNQAYRQAHREEIRARDRAYYYAHLQEMHAKVRAHHRVRNTVADQAYYEAHKAEKVAAQKMRRTNRKAAVMSHYGGRCACCGEDQIDALCIDHINGDGAAHRKEIGSGRLYAWLKKNEYPAGFQVLCWNCNAVKSIRGKCILEHGLPRPARLQG